MIFIYTTFHLILKSSAFNFNFAFVHNSKGILYLSISLQVQASQPTEVNMYYQNTYQTMPYGASYGIPYSYTAYGSSDAKPQKTDSTVPFKTPSNEMAPVTIDLVKKQLKDR